MADEEDTADDFEEELDEEELDEEVLDDELADDDLVEGDEGFVAEGGDDVVVEDEDEEEAAAEPVARRKKGDDEAEEDEDEFDPDDVEADLDTILKDRIAASEDEPDDEDELEQAAPGPADTPDGVTPKRANEFMCTGCFLLVNPAQFGRLDNPRCPVGEEDCPAIREITGSRKR
ncbi:MAG: hypothetical protein U0Q07_02620 [Acidimicrobiales bacterium]